MSLDIMVSEGSLRFALYSFFYVFIYLLVGPTKDVAYSCFYLFSLGVIL